MHSVLARRAALHAALSVAFISPAAEHQITTAASAAAKPLATVQGDGFSVGVPSSYFRPKSPASRAKYDDTVFVAADYAAGRTASVTVTPVERLLVDSGDPLPMQAGTVRSLRDLGKPIFIAKLLVGRRDGDPLGLQPPRSGLRDVVKVDDNELIFDLLTVTTTATSLTSAVPGARRTFARTIFSPDTASLISVWVSFSAPGATCVESECPPCGGLRCECPPPKCTLPDADVDALVLDIVGSLRV